MRIRTILLILSPLVGLGVIWGVSLRTGASLASVTSPISLEAQIATAMAFVLSLLGRGARIAFLARGLGSPLSLRSAVATQLTGESAAAATPSRSGSDPARLLFLRRLGVDVPSGIAVVLGEIMAEGLVLLVMILALLLLLSAPPGVVLGALPYAVTSLAMPLVAFLLVRRPGSRTPPRLWRWMRLRESRWRKLRAGAWRFRSRARALTRLEAGTVIKVLLASLVHVLARLSILPILTLGMVPGGSLGTLVAWPLLFLYTGSLLPPPGGGGAVELAFVAALTPVLGSEPLAGILLWWRFYTFYLGALLGGLVLAMVFGRSGLSALGLGSKERERVLEEHAVVLGRGR